MQHCTMEQNNFFEFLRRKELNERLGETKTNGHSRDGSMQTILFASAFRLFNVRSTSCWQLGAPASTQILRNVRVDQTASDNKHRRTCTSNRT